MLLFSIAYFSIESIDCIPLSLLAFNVVLLTFSAYELCFSLLNLRCDHNIILLVFMNSL